MTAWLNPTQVKTYAQKSYDQFLEGTFADEAAFETWITDVLSPAIEAHINSICDRDFNAEASVPAAIKDIANRAAANTLKYMIANKQEPLVRVEDFKVLIPEQATFTPELRDLLERWRTKAIIVKSSDYAVIEE